MKRAPLIQSMSYKKDHYYAHFRINGSLNADHYPVHECLCRETTTWGTRQPCELTTTEMSKYSIISTEAMSHTKVNLHS